MKNITILFTTILSLMLSVNSFAKECNLKAGLSSKQIKALKRAKKIKRIGPNSALLGKNVYKIDIMANGDESLFVVLLGEAHIKGPRSAIYGANVVKHFPIRLLEGLPLKESQYISENLSQLNDSLGWQRTVARLITFNFFGSTITNAQKKGVTFLPGFNFYMVNKKQKKISNATELAGDVVQLLNSSTIDEKDLKKGLNLPLEVGQFETPSTESEYILNKRNQRMVSTFNEYRDSGILKKVNLMIVGSAHNEGLMELLTQENMEKCSNF